ncbi:MAG: M48 family metallopeptidase [Nitrospira sp.]|nr:M48 family metallopeptidase [Nitrospira sp.]
MTAKRKQDRAHDLDTWDRLAGLPIGRRAALYCGAHGLAGLWGLLKASTTLSALASLAGCYKAPGTARDQFIYLSPEKEIAMGVSAFRDILRAAPLSPDPNINDMVHRVGERIAKAANKPEYNWEFVVIEEPNMINAFCLPGGKVAVFSGILSVTKDDTGLATVMGHEVAHALQRHGAERVSRSILEQIAQLGTMAAAVTGHMNPGVMQGIQSAYGVGVSLPFNRKQESEADYIGLQLMAKAGYDPRQAVNFWERMSGCPRKMIGTLCFRSGASMPEFLSTHPSDVTRMNQLESWLPNAMQYYHPEMPVPQPTPGVPAPPYQPLIGPPEPKRIG